MIQTQRRMPLQEILGYDIGKHQHACMRLTAIVHVAHHKLEGKA